MSNAYIFNTLPAELKYLQYDQRIYLSAYFVALLDAVGMWCGCLSILQLEGKYAQCFPC